MQNSASLKKDHCNCDFRIWKVIFLFWSCWRKTNRKNRKKQKGKICPEGGFCQKWLDFFGEKWITLTVCNDSKETGDFRCTYLVWPCGDFEGFQKSQNALKIGKAVSFGNFRKNAPPIPQRVVGMVVDKGCHYLWYTKNTIFCVLSKHSIW